jgi:hypothetical protein
MNNQYYRKYSSFPQNPAGLGADLRLSPTYLRCKLTFNLDDYGESKHEESLK